MNLSAVLWRIKFCIHGPVICVISKLFRVIDSLVTSIPGYWIHLVVISFEIMRYLLAEQPQFQADCVRNKSLSKMIYLIHMNTFRPMLIMHSLPVSAKPRMTSDIQLCFQKIINIIIFIICAPSKALLNVMIFPVM